MVSGIVGRVNKELLIFYLLKIESSRTFTGEPNFKKLTR